MPVRVRLPAALPLPPANGPTSRRRRSADTRSLPLRLAACCLLLLLPTRRANDTKSARRAIAKQPVVVCAAERNSGLTAA